jgi:deazaflavin-dependent oxidoreductase (nitroreductase family)
MPVLQLVTTGHRSGERRSVLLTHLPDGDAVVVIGTNAGADHDPAWARNLQADPSCRFRRDGRWSQATATFLDGDERERWWNAAVAANGAYEHYAAGLERVVPVVRLDPSR